MFQQDYILRQIELMAKGVGRLLGQQSSLEALDGIVGEDGSVSGEGYLEYMLTSLVRDGRIGDAEDLLYETIEAHPRKEYWPVAVAFYESLARMTEQELNAGNFSYQEALDGLEGIKKIYEDRANDGSHNG